MKEAALLTDVWVATHRLVDAMSLLTPPGCQRNKRLQHLYLQILLITCPLEYVKPGSPNQSNSRETCWSCPHTKQLWSKLSTFIVHHIDPHFFITLENVLFGFGEYDSNLCSQFYLIHHYLIAYYFDQILYSQTQISNKQKAIHFSGDFPYQTINFFHI